MSLELNIVFLLNLIYYIIVAKYRVDMILVAMT